MINKVQKQKTEKASDISTKTNKKGRKTMDPETKKLNSRTAVNWCFTDFELLNFEQIYNDNIDKIRYICYGKETCPTTGKTHFQGWIQLYKKIRLNGLKKLIGSNKIHVSICLGDEASNEKYCKKDNDFKSFGKFSIQGKSNDLESLIESMKAGKTMTELFEEYPKLFFQHSNKIKATRLQIYEPITAQFRKVKVYVLQGPSGCGKTRTAMQFAKYKTEFNNLPWWDQYDFQESILIDEFANQVRITDLLTILDGQQLKLPIKGGFTYANWTTVYITTNLPFNKWYPDALEIHRIALIRRISGWFDYNIKPLVNSIDIICKFNFNLIHEELIAQEPIPISSFDEIKKGDEESIKAYLELYKNDNHCFDD